jgi:hypothetical protein
MEAAAPLPLEASVAHRGEVGLKGDIKPRPRAVTALEPSTDEHQDWAASAYGFPTADQRLNSNVGEEGSGVSIIFAKGAR